MMGDGTVYDEAWDETAKELVSFLLQVVGTKVIPLKIVNKKKIEFSPIFLMSVTD